MLLKSSVAGCVALIAMTTVAITSAQDANLSALEERAFQQAAAAVQPAIVRIDTVGGLDVVGDLITGTGASTGVIISADGLILTSSFHFAALPSGVIVTLPDGKRAAATVVATDHARKLTLLKCDVAGLQPIRSATAEDVAVGQWAIALGRTYQTPFPSVSVGIISATGRIWGRALQTDAKVSPINYGGPLVDIEGRALGILVPLSPQADDKVAGIEWYDAGIGFAIPMPDALASAERLRSGDDLRPGLLGIGIAESGPLAGQPQIKQVRALSPADEAGLQPDDVITAIDDQPITRQYEFKQIIGQKYAGDEVVLAIVRNDESLTMKLTLTGELKPYEFAYLGVLPERSAVGQAEPTKGVKLRHVFADSPAAMAGLEKRDVIVGINGTEVADTVALTDQLRRLQPGDEIALTRMRNDESKEVKVTLGTYPDSVPDELTPSLIVPPEEGSDLPKTGRFNDTLPGEGGDYWAYVPDSYNPSYAYGLLVWLHPQGDTMEAAIYSRWKAVCDRRGMILVGVKAADINRWNPAETEVVKAVIEKMTGTYRIDAQRIAVHGYQRGAMLAWVTALKQTDLIRAVSLVGTAPPPRIPPTEPDARLQIHLLCGGDDPSLGDIRLAAEALRKQQYPVVLDVPGGLGQAYPEGAAIEALARWLDLLDRL